MQSLADCFPALFYRMPRALLDAESTERMAMIARHLPARFAIHQLRLVCPLGSLAAGADLLVGAQRMQNGPQLLKETAVHMLNESGQILSDDRCYQPVPPHAGFGPVWKSVAGLAGVWAQPPWDCRLDNLWLHFDVLGANQATPNLLLGPLIENDDDRLWRAWAHEVAPTMYGYPIDEILLDLLMRCCELLPAQAGVVQIGVMRARGAPDIRVRISDIDGEMLLGYLSCLGIQYDAAAYRQTLHWLQRYADRFTLQLDLPIRNRTAISLGCYLDADSGAQPLTERWALFLQALEARGLCQPEKNTALSQFPAVLEGQNHLAHWPHDALQMQHLMCRKSILRRRIHHIKLDFCHHGVKRAKAHLAVTHEWGSALYSQLSGSC